MEALGKRGETNEEIVGVLLRAHLLDPADPVKVEATKAVPRLAGPTEPAIDGLYAPFLKRETMHWVQVHATRLGLGPSSARRPLKQEQAFAARRPDSRIEVCGEQAITARPGDDPTA